MITECKGADVSKHEIEGTMSETTRHRRGYKLFVKGSIHELEADKNFNSMDYAPGASIPFNSKVIKFKNVDDPKKHDKCQVHAIIKLWKICEKELRIKIFNTYSFCDPVVTESFFEDKLAQKVIHTCADGEAYMLQKVGSNPTQVCVIDQTWPNNMGKLPLDKEISKRINEKNDEDICKMSEFLQHQEIRPR